MRQLKDKLGRITVLALTAAMLLLSWGCGDSSGPNPTPPTPDEKYEYGEDWQDAYDAAYTQSLLDMGETEFTLSQIAGTDGIGRTVSARAERKDGK